MEKKKKNAIMEIPSLYPLLLNDVYIYDNIIENTGWDGIQVSMVEINCKIYNNRILRYGLSGNSNHYGGIQINNGTTGQCYNNFIADGKGAGIVLLGVGFNSIYNNVILNAGKDHYPEISSRGANGIYFGTKAAYEKPYYFINNTILNSKNDQIKINGNDYSGDELYIYNNLLVDETVSSSQPEDIDKYIDLFNSDDITIYDTNNIGYNDLSYFDFINSENLDFRLQNSSVAINQGKDTLDFDHAFFPRDNQPDVGAFECHNSIQWVEANTSQGYYSLIIPSNSTIEIDGESISAGDTIGLFYYDTIGVLRCCGYTEFDGTGDTINASGIDSGAIMKCIILDDSQEQFYIPTVYKNSVTLDLVYDTASSVTIDYMIVKSLTIDQWISPVSACGLDDSVEIKISLTNTGIYPETEAFYLSYTLDSGQNYSATETLTSPIHYNQSIIYTFENLAEFDSIGEMWHYSAAIAGIDILAFDSLENFAIDTTLEIYTNLSDLYCDYDSLDRMLTGLHDEDSAVFYGVAVYRDFIDEDSTFSSEDSIRDYYFNPDDAYNGFHTIYYTTPRNTATQCFSKISKDIEIVWGLNADYRMSSNTFCEGEELEISYASRYDTIYWLTPDSILLSDNAFLTVDSILFKEIDSLLIKVNERGCWDRANQQFPEIYPPFHIKPFGNDTFVNASSDITLSVQNSVYDRYLWYDGETTSTNIFYSDSIGTYGYSIYWVEARDNVNDCWYRDTFLLRRVTNQDIHLRDGWGIFSTYLEPLENNFDSIFAELDTNLLEVADEYGNKYYPDSITNDLDSITIGEAYEINVEDADTLTITGLPIIPEETELLIDSGWSMIGYLKQYELGVDDIFGYMLEDTVEMIKDEIGLIYWKEFNIDQIGDMNPGKGYEISTAVEEFFSYPPNIPSLKYYSDFKNPHHFKNVSISNNNMALGIPYNSWAILLEIGDEIGVFTQDNVLVGSIVYTEKSMGITVRGDISTTFDLIEGLSLNEELKIKLWKKNKNLEYTIKVNKWEEGDGKYIPNKIAIVADFEILPYSQEFSFISNHPNPFSDLTYIQFYSPTEETVSLEVFDLHGRSVVPNQIINCISGNNKIIVDAKHFVSGIYVGVLRSANNQINFKLNCIK